MVPKGWQFSKLGSVAELQRGFDLPSTKRIDGNVPIVSSSGVSGYHNEHKVEKPGIVTGRYGSIGNVYYVEKDFWPLNRSLWVKDFYGNYPKFIYYLLSSFDFKKFSDKTGVPGVNRNDLHAVKVLVPPILEQQRIVKILSTWDKAISTTERLIDNSTQQKKALMQQLLTGKKRLLDESGKRFEGEWKIKKVSDYFDVSSSKRVLQEDWKDEGVPFYRTRELVSLAKNEPFRSSIYIAEGYYKKLITKYGMPDEGDFLVSGVGTLGVIYQVRENDKFYFKDGNVLWFRKEKEVSSDFFKYCFLSDYIRNQINIQASVTTVGTYTITNAKKTRFHCPPLEEQQKIATVLTNADKEIELLEQQLADLQQEKKALMQVLLTGKKRVVVDGEC